MEDHLHSTVKVQCICEMWQSFVTQMSFEATLDTGCYNKYLSAFDILAMHALYSCWRHKRPLAKSLGCTLCEKFIKVYNLVQQNMKTLMP